MAEAKAYTKEQIEKLRHQINSVMVGQFIATLDARDARIAELEERIGELNDLLDFARNRT